MEETEKWVPRNWKKLNEQALNDLPLIQKSRYMAYEGPSNRANDALNEAKKRLLERKKHEDSLLPKITKEEREDIQKYINIMARLKAAEARDRLRLLQLHYEARHARVIEKVVTYRPTALQGLRLECLLTAKPLAQIRLANRKCEDLKPDKVTRKRIEELMNPCSARELVRT